MTFSRLLSRAVLGTQGGSRSMFTSSKPQPTDTNRFRVGLAYASTAFLWGLLFRQHSRDVQEYKVRNGLE